MRRSPLSALILLSSLSACGHENPTIALAAPPSDFQLVASAAHAGTAATGQSIFRFDTFGDETFWIDTLHMQQVIGSKVSPKTALSVGLKVDATALPPTVVEGIKNGTV